MLRPPQLLFALACAMAPGAPLAAQTVADTAAAQPPPATGEGDIDVDAPMAELPGIGVDWPDAGDPLPPMAPLPPAPPVIAGGDDSDFAPVEADPTAPVELADDGDGAIPVDLIDGDRRYRYVLDGLGAIANRRFRDRFQMLSLLAQGEDDPANAAQINRRSIEDQRLIEALVRNAGYYDATITRSIDASAPVVTVRFSALPGPRYTYGAVNIPGIDTLPADEADRVRRLYGIDPGEPVVGDTIVKSQALLTAELRETGYPFASVGDELVTIDHDTRLATLDQPVSPGERLRFGDIIARDNGLLGADHIQRIARFAPRELYRQSGVEDLRRALLATGLASSVDLTPQPGSDAGSVDMVAEIEAAPLRTISAGFGYGTGDGLRVEAGWQHRNLFPPEGALILRGVLGTREQSGTVTLRRNNWRARDRVLTLQLLVANSDVPAFEARTINVSARVERISTLLYQKRWTWSAEAEVLGTDEQSYDLARAGIVSRRYAIVSMGGHVALDRSNDLLDPARGFRLSLRLFPELSVQSDVFGYVRGQVDGSLYIPAGGRSVIAGRVRFGSIIGASRNRIAPSRRLYAGGGSSVRGYGYQAVGPMDPNGDPLGGNSLVELSLEARVPVWGAFSLVPFVDAGTVSASSLPRGSDLSDMRFGAGLGVRYASNFGPIRIDVGTPLNRRAGDSRIGVYVSLGQAF